MNTDPRKSASPCGCDVGENHLCEQHAQEAAVERMVTGAKTVDRNGLWRGLFPNSAQGRKDHPIFTRQQDGE